jgi:hypothetical protein
LRSLSIGFESRRKEPFLPSFVKGKKTPRGVQLGITIQPIYR